jgi:D-alanyl-D-alanine carboxypeptidase
LTTSARACRVSCSRTAVALVVTAALALAACGDDDSASDVAANTTAPPTDPSAVADTASTSETPASSASMPETSVAGTTPAETNGEPDRGAFESTIDDAAAMLLEAAAANGATAAHVAISDPEFGDYAQAYGTVAIGGEEASLDDTFPIGSITTTFTAVVILQMVESGDLSLDATVGDLLPGLAAEFPDLAPLTVEQLLSMTSGVEDYLNVPDSVVAEIMADPMRVWEPEELIAAGIEAGVSPPGTPGYSTTNYIVLQLIAEAVGGAPLEDLIATMVTDPLAMENTYLPPADDTTLPEPFTHG